MRNMFYSVILNYREKLIYKFQNIYFEGLILKYKTQYIFEHNEMLNTTF